MSGDVLLAVLGAKERRTFSGLTVRHRTRVCTTTGDPDVATCGAWGPTLKAPSRALEVSVKAATQWYGWPEYRNAWIKEVGPGLTPNLPDFYLSVPDREVRMNGRVQNVNSAGLTNEPYHANVLSEGVTSRGTDRCLWVKGRLRLHNGLTTPDNQWGSTEQEILYTASNYPLHEL